MHCAKKSGEGGNVNYSAENVKKSNAHQSQHEFELSIPRNRYSILHKVKEVYFETLEIQELYSMLRPIHHFQHSLEVRFSQKFVFYIHVETRVMTSPFVNLTGLEEENIKHLIRHDDHQDGNWIPKVEQTK